MGWAQLRGYRERNVRNAEAEDEEPRECPIDGALLKRNKDGVLNCPLGNYTWEG